MKKKTMMIAGPALSLAGLLALLTASAALAAITLSLPGDVTTEATGPQTPVSYTVSATDDDGGAPTIVCNPASGSNFPVATTNVSCTATDPDDPADTASGNFNVTVRDTTPPSVTPPPNQTAEATSSSGAPVSYPNGTATDAVAGTPAVTCAPPSGSTFPLGPSTVTCTASDGTNTGTATFTVSVVDTTAPVVTVSAPATAEATGPSGATVTFSASATDAVAGSITPSCNPASGSTFALGQTNVTCTASDGTNTGSASATITVRDTTAPVVTVPGPITTQATSPGGTSVSYSASASDSVSGSLAPSCNPPAGGTFPLGTTTVTCTATDAAGNSGSASFTVTVNDAAGPDFGDVPGPLTVEANGPRGSAVSFSTPTAVDSVDGPVPTSCSPSSGATFPLGNTRVFCRAKDSGGNEASVSFIVTVVDRKAPVLTVPAAITVSSQGGSSQSATAGTIATFLDGAVATDLVDGKVPVKHDAPASFPLGATTVTFTATDKSGNTAKETSRVTVVRGAVQQPTKPLDRKPPGNVRNLSAKAGNRVVTLSWRPPSDRDFKQVVITRATQSEDTRETAVYRGPALRFVDRSLTNGVQYRYVVVSYDQAGNRSAGVAAVASPKATALISPADGAVVKAPPLLRWVRVAGAPFYNVQLFRGARLVKVMTTWPNANRLQLPRTWVYEGRRQRLVPGLYRWFVWPGFGRPAARKYGPLLGQSTFRVVGA